MSANLITGNLFKPIYAYQDADYQAGISGNVTSIMPVGSQMALSIEDANTIKADDGVLITKEGRRIQIDAGAIEEWSIPTGTQGATHYFIIGFHLYTDSNSAEVCETFVEQMENATDTIPESTFREGSTEVYVSLGRVVQNGINLDSVTSLVQIAQSFEDVRNAIAQLNSDLGSKSSASAVTGNDAFSKIATLNSDLGSKSSASAVTGNDAFSKIATLNTSLTSSVTNINNNKEYKPSSRVINAQTDLLRVILGDNDHVINQPYYFSTDYGALTNLPPNVPRVFYGWREVKCVMSLTTVILHEMYPNYGRTWLNTYDTNVNNWYGWRSMGGNMRPNFSNLLASLTTDGTVTATTDSFLVGTINQYGELFINNVNIGRTGDKPVNFYLPLKAGDIVKISNYAQQTTEARIRIYGVLS